MSEIVKHRARLDTSDGRSLGLVSEDGKTLFASVSFNRPDGSGIQRTAKELAEALLFTARGYIAMLSDQDGNNHEIPGIGDKESLTDAIENLQK